MKPFLSLLLAIFPFVLSAQIITESHTHTTTPEAHLFATFVKSFDHGLALTFEEEIRSAPSHRAHTTVALGYTPIPYLNIYAGYTLKLYGNQGWTDPNKYLQHRANVLLTGQVKLGQWNLSLREGVMLDARAGEVDKRVKNQVDFTLRSRLQAVYSIPKTPLGIVAKFEILNTLNAPVAYINSLHHTTQLYTTLHNSTLHYTTLHNTTLHNSTPHYTTPHHATPHYTTPHHATPHYGQYISELRPEIGLQWKINKQHSLTLTYRYNYLYDRALSIDDASGDISLNHKRTTKHLILLAYKLGW